MRAGRASSGVPGTVADPRPDASPRTSSSATSGCHGSAPSRSARSIGGPQALFAALGLAPIPPDAPVRTLSIGDRQLVEIAKGLARDPTILILDEATSALLPGEVDWLLSKRARARGGRQARPLHLAPHGRGAARGRPGHRAAERRDGRHRSDGQAQRRRHRRDDARPPTRPAVPAAQADRNRAGRAQGRPASSVGHQSARRELSTFTTARCSGSPDCRATASASCSWRSSVPNDATGRSRGLGQAGHHPRTRPCALGRDRHGAAAGGPAQPGAAARQAGAREHRAQCIEARRRRAGSSISRPSASWSTRR